MTAKPKLVHLFKGRQHDHDEDEVRVGLPLAAPASHAGLPKGRELAGAPVGFLIGAGQTGKSTFARWVGSRAAEAGRDLTLAAVDAGSRTVADFFDEVQQPMLAGAPTRDPIIVARWFRDGLTDLMAAQAPALFDMGGNDTTLSATLDRAPTLVVTLEEAGLAPVAWYFFGPRASDLDALATLEPRGFQPAATALVLNAGRVDATMDPADAFLAIRRHSAFRAAVGRGAVVIEMPRLDPDIALEIERKRLHFAQARDGLVPPGRKTLPMGPFDRAHVRRWLEQMEAAFAPVQHWLP